jgi:hypothetical protein
MKILKMDSMRIWLLWGFLGVIGLTGCAPDDKKAAPGAETGPVQPTPSASEAANPDIPKEELRRVLQTWSQDMVKAFPGKFARAEAPEAQLVVFYWDDGVKPEDRAKEEQMLTAGLQIRLLDALAKNNLNPGLASSVRFRFDRNNQN